MEIGRCLDGGSLCSHCRTRLDGRHTETKGTAMNTTVSNEDLLEAWTTDADVTAARAAVDSELTATDLVARITKMSIAY